MAELETLQPHDPVPDGPGVTVLKRFDEDQPDRVVVQIVLVDRRGERSTVEPQGGRMGWDEALDAARRVADSEGLARVWVVDRTAGPLEHEVIEREGDHSAPDRALLDSDVEDGERGSDMTR